MSRAILLRPVVSCIQRSAQFFGQRFNKNRGGSGDETISYSESSGCVASGFVDWSGNLRKSIKLVSLLVFLLKALFFTCIIYPRISVVKTFQHSESFQATNYWPKRLGTRLGHFFPMATIIHSVFPSLFKICNPREVLMIKTSINKKANS